VLPQTCVRSSRRTPRSSGWRKRAEVGLYLCVFSSEAADDEVDGVEVGSYDDFHSLRATVAQGLENGQWGSRFPVLMSHPDSDGEWSPAEATALAGELEIIGTEFAALPARNFATGSWQEGVAGSLGLAPKTLRECFIDVDGELLLERLRELALTAAKLGP
jgi:Immunity protein 70